eukprot:9115324-Alexandrium_andersonii.AAC.1
MSASLVGSEMCIRDSLSAVRVRELARPRRLDSVECSGCGISWAEAVAEAEQRTQCRDMRRL